jgi:hypothetical protein
MKTKPEEMKCSNCKFNYIQYRTYRDMCRKGTQEFVIPDDVLNWILVFGCASWKDGRKI